MKYAYDMLKHTDKLDTSWMPRPMQYLLAFTSWIIIVLLSYPSFYRSTVGDLQLGPSLIWLLQLIMCVITFIS